MAKKKKSTQQPPEIQMVSSTDIKVITGIKLKCLSEKISEYGANHMFQVLDETHLQELVEFKRSEKPIWEYNGKYYHNLDAWMVKLTDENVNDVAVSEPQTFDENGVADLPF